jgi:hypothetical protein
MKRTVMTALVAVFLSLAVTGCYTKLKGPEPGTGLETYPNYYYEYPYYGGYYNPFYFQYGWYSPFYFGYPSFYGGFYNPWWYDPYYYGDGYNHDGGYPPGKEPRERRGQGPGRQLPAVPSGTYVPTPPPSTGQSGQDYQPPPSPPPSSGNQGSSSGNDNGNSSGGKATRGRR